MNKTVIWIIIAILVLVVLYFGFSYLNENQNPALENITLSENQGLAENEPEPQTIQEIQAVFPDSFPFEDDAQSFQGFTLDVEGRDQYVFTYESNLTLEENRALFEQYLTQNNYEITEEHEETESLLYSATNASGQLFIGIQELEGKVLINGSYTAN